MEVLNLGMEVSWVFYTSVFKGKRLLKSYYKYSQHFKQAQFSENKEEDFIKCELVGKKEKPNRSRIIF